MATKKKTTKKKTTRKKTTAKKKSTRTTNAKKRTSKKKTAKKKTSAKKKPVRKKTNAKKRTSAKKKTTRKKSTRRKKNAEAKKDDGPGLTEVQRAGVGGVAGAALAGPIGAGAGAWLGAKLNPGAVIPIPMDNPSDPVRELVLRKRREARKRAAKGRMYQRVAGRSMGRRGYERRSYAPIAAEIHGRRKSAALRRLNPISEWERGSVETYEAAQQHARREQHAIEDQTIEDLQYFGDKLNLIEHHLQNRTLHSAILELGLALAFTGEMTERAAHGWFYDEEGRKVEGEGPLSKGDEQRLSVARNFQSALTQATYQVAQGDYGAALKTIAAMKAGLSIIWEDKTIFAL